MFWILFCNLDFATCIRDSDHIPNLIEKCVATRNTQGYINSLGALIFIVHVVLFTCLYMINKLIYIREDNITFSNTSTTQE